MPRRSQWSLPASPLCIGGTCAIKDEEVPAADFRPVCAPPRSSCSLLVLGPWSPALPHDAGVLIACSREAAVVNELVSHLPLQMLLYFNIFYFPCWWFSAVFMLEVKFHYLPGYYQALLITGMILLTIIEVVRLYLGYVGNLREKVPELAAFCLLSFMFQLPVLLFFLTDEGILILPLERAVHSLYLAFLLAQILASFLALRTMTRKLTLLFHLRQFGRVESLGHAGMSPVCGSPCRRRRGALPVSPTHHVHR
ncbi:transmembrane protein 17A [Gasterosteus aculeatus]